MGQAERRRCKLVKEAQEKKGKISQSRKKETCC